MTVSDLFSLLAGLIFTISGVLYVRDVATQRVRPNIASFLIFALSSVSLLASLIIKGVWHVVPFTSVTLIVSLLVVILSFKSKKFYLALADKVGFIGALLGLVVWVITGDAAWNVYILAFIGAVSFMPIIIKSFKHPELESTLPWQLNLLGSVFLILAIPSTEPVQWIVPAQQFVCSFLLNLGLFIGVTQKKGTTNDV